MKFGFLFVVVFLSSCVNYYDSDGLTESDPVLYLNKKINNLPEGKSKKRKSEKVVGYDGKVDKEKLVYFYVLDDPCDINSRRRLSSKIESVRLKKDKELYVLIVENNKPFFNSETFTPRQSLYKFIPEEYGRYNLTDLGVKDLNARKRPLGYKYIKKPYCDTVS